VQHLTGTTPPQRHDSQVHMSGLRSHASCVRSASAMYSACLMARATMVSVGFAAAPEVKTDPSEMKRFFTSWVRPHLSTTPSSGRSLMRAVPRLCVDGYGGV